MPLELSPRSKTTKNDHLIYCFIISLLPKKLKSKGTSGRRLERKEEVITTRRGCTQIGFSQKAVSANLI